MNNGNTIFLTIGSGVILRNILLVPNGVLDGLKKKFSKIILLVPKRAEEQVKKDFEGDNVFVEGLDMYTNNDRTFFQKLFLFVCDYLIFTPGMKMFAWSAALRSDTKVGGGKKYLYPVKLFIYYTFGRLTILRSSLARLLDKHIFTERYYKNVFDKYSPDLVFLSNVYFFLDQEVLREARRRNIKTIGMPGSWDHLPKRFVANKPDKLLVWNKPNYDEAVNLHKYKSKDVKIVGVPQYDIFANKNFIKNKESFFKEINLNSKYKTILFVSEGAYSPHDADIVNSIINARERGVLPANLQLIIRPYPGQKKEHKKFDRFEGVSGIYIDWVSSNESFSLTEPWYPSLDDAIHFVNLLKYSDLIINTYSSTAIEASIFLKPIIGINYDGNHKEEFAYSVKRFQNLSHYQHILSTGGIIFVDSEKDLLDKLLLFINDNKSNLSNIKKIQNLMCYKIDGLSSIRIVDECII